MISWIIVTLSSLLCGYIWGKSVGNKLGKQVTTAVIPLALRQQSFEKGYCVLCHRVFRRKMISNTSDKQKSSC
jgi:hypothetical protein